jgi:hypothetical protein
MIKVFTALNPEGASFMERMLEENGIACVMGIRWARGSMNMVQRGDR